MSHTQSTKREGYVLIGTLLFIGLMGSLLSSYVKVWSTADIRVREAELRFSLIQLQRGVERYEREYGYPPRDLEELEDGSYIRKPFRDPFREERDSKWHEDWDYIQGSVSSRSRKRSISGMEYSRWTAVRKEKGYEIKIRRSEEDQGG